MNWKLSTFFQFLALVLMPRSSLSQKDVSLWLTNPTSRRYFSCKQRRYHSHHLGKAI